MTLHAAPRQVGQVSWRNSAGERRSGLFACAGKYVSEFCAGNAVSVMGCLGCGSSDARKRGSPDAHCEGLEARPAPAEPAVDSAPCRRLGIERRGASCGPRCCLKRSRELSVRLGELATEGSNHEAAPPPGAIPIVPAPRDEPDVAGSHFVGATGKLPLRGVRHSPPTVASPAATTRASASMASRARAAASR